MQYPTFTRGVFIFCLLAVSSNAAPTPIPAAYPQLLDTVGSLTSSLLSFLENTIDRLLDPPPGTEPSSIDDVQNYLKTRYRNQNTGFINNGLDYVANGLVGVKGISGATINAQPAGINSFNNINPNAPISLYPKAHLDDAPYSISEEQLRSAIYIPLTFDPRDAPTPVLLVPGTGAFGGINFEANFIKILATNPSIGQAVWLNIPDAMLADAQINSEYIAYAMNYVGALTSTTVSVLG